MSCPNCGRSRFYKEFKNSSKWVCHACKKSGSIIEGKAILAKGKKRKKGSIGHNVKKLRSHIERQKMILSSEVSREEK
jgi:transcription initiation factor TFIIIB Brf1 subunit/transcription initiation factor TFIIB